MDIGVIGLGRMGGNMARRLLAGGHRVVGLDRGGEAVRALEAAGGAGAASLDALVAALPRPRAVWLMLPAGAATEEVTLALADLLERDDVVVDGGNAHFEDDVRRAQLLAAKGIRHLAAGTSGGVHGLERGYCLMVGGDREAFERLAPVFRTLAPGRDAAPPTPGRAPGGTAEEGWLHCGPSGAGHFVKMIHNGIEYGALQAYAEGYEILHASKEFKLDLHRIAAVWNHGSVVRSWINELAELAFERDANLDQLKGYVEDSGEGRWTVQEAIDLDVPAPVITLSLLARLRSRQPDSFSAKVIAALRNEFGGHAVKKA